MVIQAPVLQMSAATRSQSSISRGESCSPQVIRISLQHLGCKRRVSTTMCYGECESFSYPNKRNFKYPVKHSSDLHNVCRCCTPTQIEKIAHTLTCRMGSRISTKTFYVANMKSCACRPCGGH
ncbi:mucin-19-like [Corticium candelabrum]|uniref:mucin-19-like n=1 Tax=Corticium candelabrum TaxID=121492 RepID=UPI002E2684A9|nr:mucin-19-like [Corticium candelabrum]